MAEIFTKTWKRETAWALMVWLFGAISYVLYVDLMAGVELLKMCVIPVTAFAGGVFGLHVYQNKVASDKVPEAPPPPTPPDDYFPEN